MKENIKQLQTLLFLGILLLVRPIEPSEKKISNINLAPWPHAQIDQLLKPHALIAKKLKDKLRIHLAALLVVLEQNKKKEAS